MFQQLLSKVKLDILEANYLKEMDDTFNKNELLKIFTNPKKQETNDYITGRFG